MLTTILRLFLGKQFKPFKFKSKYDSLPDLNVPELGGYIHIPFCKSICPFCPYYKVSYDREVMDSYIGALLKEITLVSGRTFTAKRDLTSLYFGGGSPALAGDRLIEINKTIDKYYTVKGNRGIELNPEDVTDLNIDILKKSKIDMVSLGVQSFSEDLNKVLGREVCDNKRALKLLSVSDFKVIDVDLIFGIPTQSSKQLVSDFRLAAENGATQISTYPYIDFSYADNRYKPLGFIAKKRLLKSLLNISKELGYIRTSVWTFSKKGTDIYSSVTRDNFVGFGASATTLGLDCFKANVFSVKEYIKSVNSGKIPTNLNMTFTGRSRKLYWLFWSIYNGSISEKRYFKLFGGMLKKEFKCSLFIGRVLGILKKEDTDWLVTTRGAYLFHLVEQVYTHQYIDKTWRSSLHDPWVKEINLY